MISTAAPVKAERGKSFVLFRYERESTTSFYKRCFNPLKVLLHEDIWSPLHQPLLTDAFTLSHFHNRIALSVKQFIHLDTSPKKCFSTNGYFRCLYQCVETLLKSILNCRLPYMDTLPLKECETANEALKSYKASYRLLSSIQMENCDCSKQCNEIIYSSKFLIDHVGKAARSINTFINIPDGIIQVTEDYLAYDIISLLSDIGGNLGLYMGLCVLSVLDIIELLSHHIKNLISNSTSL